MAEPSSTAVSAFMASWFTPTSVFLFINLVIGTLIITSRFTISTKRRRDSAASATLARSPSLLDRVKSINRFSHYYHYYTEPEYAQVNPPSLGRQPSLLQRLKSVNFSPSRYYLPESAPETNGVNDHTPRTSLLQRLRSTKLSSYPDSDSHAQRANSDTLPCDGEFPAKLPGKMRKSASHKSAFGHFEQDATEEDATELLQPPESEDESEAGQEQIDAKVDDFIARFRQQLKLQKLESFMRYKEMLTRAHETI